MLPWKLNNGFTLLCCSVTKYFANAVNNKNVFRSHVKCPILSSSDFNQIFRFSTGFRKSSQYQISRKSVQWEPPWYRRTHGVTDRRDEFLISNFRRVLNAVCFLLGNSPASEFCMPTFRNTLLHLHRQVGMKCIVASIKLCCV